MQKCNNSTVYNFYHNAAKGPVLSQETWLETSLTHPALQLPLPISPVPSFFTRHKGQLKSNQGSQFSILQMPTCGDMKSGDFSFMLPQHQLSTTPPPNFKKWFSPPHPNKMDLPSQITEMAMFECLSRCGCMKML